MSMPARSLRFASCLALAFAAGCGQGGVATPPSPVAPTAAEVKALVDVGYQRPALHTVVAVPPRAADDRVIIWTRQYDGVELGSDARSTLHPDGVWRTRFLRELAEPEPVRRAELWTFDRAAARAGLADAFARGRVKARLLYRPELRLESKVPNPTNAVDVEHVIDHWRLVIELDDAEGRRTHHVDAYTGEPAGDWSHEVATGLNVTTVNYGADVIDATMLPFVRGFLYRDTIRSSLVDSSSGSLINGQGIASGMPKSAASALSWVRVVTTSNIDNDIAFTLEQAWDYFASTFGRRGLRNQAASPTTTANDAIVFFDPTDPQLNAFMDATTGLIRITQPAGWQNFMTADVLGHEWTHAVFDADADHNHPDSYWGANGGINEANSDLFGELIEARARHVAGLQPTDDISDGWILGQGNPQLARNMCSPLLSADKGYRDIWSPDLDNPTPPVDAHYAATPIDRVFCLLSRGMVKYGTATTPELQSLVVPNGFPPLGTAAVAQLEYQALTFLRGAPQPVATFLDLRHSLLDAATAIYGEYSDPYKDIQDAFAVIGVDAPADRAPPVITLTSGTLLSHTAPITVAIGTASKVTSVIFNLDGTNIGTVTAPPWQLTPPMEPEGHHTLSVTATDAHRNTATTQWAVTYDSSGPGVTLTDVTPCPQWWCGDYQYKRLYRVDATDFSGVATEWLYLDGPPVGSASGASNVFTVNYTVGGSHSLQARAVDTLGNGSSTAWQTFDIDLTPPRFSSGPTFTADPSYEGRFRYTFCVAFDPSGWNTYLELDGVRTTFQQISVSGSCTTLQVSAVPTGSHQYKLHLFDRWNNDNVKSGNITLPKIPPTVGIPTVAVDTVTIGHVVVGATYGATHGIASVALQICDANGCGASTVFTPSNSATDQSSHSFNVTGLLAGHSYAAQVSVTGFNGLTTMKRSMGFTIPGGQTNNDVVFNEVEPNNDWQYTSNGLPNGTTVFRGSTTGGDDDWFWMHVPAGKQLCVAGAITNNNTTCTTALTMYSVQGGWIAGGNGNQLFPSRSAITSGDFVCRASSSENDFVVVDVEGPGFACPLSYDILLQIR